MSPTPKGVDLAPASPPSSPTELTALIADVRDALNVTVDAKGLSSLAAIEELFARLTRMAGTPCVLCGKLGDYDEMVCYEDEPAHPACVRLTARCIDAESLLPTAEEAAALLWELDRDEEHPYFTASVAESISAKLRALSSKGQK